MNRPYNIMVVGQEDVESLVKGLVVNFVSVDKYKLIHTLLCPLKQTKLEQSANTRIVEKSVTSPYNLTLRKH